jgi:hypothetical protein
MAGILKTWRRTQIYIISLILAGYKQNHDAYKILCCGHFTVMTSKSIYGSRKQSKTSTILLSWYCMPRMTI